MNMKERLTVLFAALTLVTLSSYAGASDQASNDPAPAAADSEKAVIVFYRTGTGGGAVQFHVHNMAGDPMGYLGKSGDSFAIEAEPGKRQYWARAASRNDVELTVESGKTYYVKAVVKLGLAVGRPVLKEVPASKVPEKYLNVSPVDNPVTPTVEER
jgi:hypothetical protein